MKRSDLLLKYYDAHIEGYACLFFILSLFKPVFFVVLALYIYLLSKKIRFFYLITVFSLILILFIYVNKNDIPKSISGNVKIVNITEKVYNKEVTVKYKFKQYIFTTTKDLELNEIIYIEGETIPLIKEVIDFGFNEKAYYYKKGIKAKLNITKLTSVQKQTKLNNLVLNKVNNLKIKPYLKMFLFNQTSTVNKELYSKLNILFLFKVSGLHLYSLVEIIKYILRKYNLNNKEHYFALIAYIFFYYLSNFNYSILRLIIITIITRINLVNHYKFTKLDLIQFTFLIMLIIKPFLLYEIGFLILYLILNFFELLKPLYEDLNKNISLSLTTQVITLPFFSYVNLFIVLIMPFLIIIVSGPLFILALLALVFPFFDGISYYFFTKFDYLLILIDQISSAFTLPKFSYLLIFLYFLLWIFILLAKNKYNKLLYFFYIILLFYLPSLKNNFFTNVYFLSVGQGDSIYLESGPYNIMIDTFNGSYNFLMNKGIKKLDYLFLTHPDNDHISEAYEIVNNIKVHNVGLSYYENYPNYYNNEKKYKAFDNIILGPFIIEVLGPLKDYKNKNENSLVLKVTIKDYKFLFTGDIEKEAEGDLTRNTNLKADVLKVAHHGSKTSSSEKFIKKVSPKYAVISLGYNNKFLFPHEEVITTLLKNDIEIYRTDLDYTIKFNYHYYYKKWLIELPFKKEIWYNIILDGVF